MRRQALLRWPSLNPHLALKSEFLVQTKQEPNSEVAEIQNGMLTNQVQFLRTFAATVGTLRSISEKELAQQALSAEEIDFLKNLIELTFQYDGLRNFNGWYPKLFYQNRFQRDFDTFYGSDRWDPLVTDVHSDAPDFESGDPGRILHNAIGNVNLLMIAVDNGSDKMVFAGPVLSHYEFEKPSLERMTDREWKLQILNEGTPPPPEWTSSYLVPGPLVLPPHIRDSEFPNGWATKQAGQ